VRGVVVFLVLILVGFVSATAAICERYAHDMQFMEPTATTEAAEPTATIEPTSIPEITATPTLYECCLLATRYGESYNGRPFGCFDLVRGIPVGVYSSDEPSILAVSPPRYTEWPCGTELELCSQLACLNVVRVDSCPGCGANHVDLSESGIAHLCGGDSCDILRNISYRVLFIPQTPAEVVDSPFIIICRFTEDIREHRC